MRVTGTPPSISPGGRQKWLYPFPLFLGQVICSDRTMLNGMLWVVQNGAHWRMLPRKYGPWQSVYARFAKWRRDGTLVAVLLALSGEKTIKEAGTFRS